MQGPFAWFSRNPVAANLLMVFIVVSGLLATGAIREEVFPNVDLDGVAIEVPYLGAAPEEVEAGVVIRIEEAVQGIDGIETIRSTAAEGAALVAVEFEIGADARRVVDEIKNQVDAITTFPIETEAPIIRELRVRNQVVDIAVAGAADIMRLKAFAERVRDELTALPEITQIEITGAPPYEIEIEVSEVALRRHRMTFDQVADAVRRSSLDLPGGSVRTAGGEILLRTVGQAYRGDEYEDLVLWTRADGSRLRLGDVATVVDSLAETDQRARFDGDPAVMLSVFRSGEQSALDITAAVERYVESARGWLPAGVSLFVWQDRSQTLRDRLGLILRNGASGLVLVFVVLALFMDLRLAFWVGLGIPVSFLGAVALMPGLDVSANTLTLFAFLLVLGIVVDDAIIVGENIFRHQERQSDVLRGCIDGVREIARPVIFAVLTTVAAFLPLLFVPGMIGKLLRVIPFVVIPCLLFSLVESLCILPAHLAHRSGGGGSPRRYRFQRIFAAGLAASIRRIYVPLLDAALRWRYVTVAIGISALALTGALVAGGRVVLRFLPSVEADFMTASVTMPQGTTAAGTSAAVDRLERAAARLRDRLREETGTDPFRHVSAAIGDQPMLARAGGPLAPRDIDRTANVGEVTVEFTAPELRPYTSEQLGALWRDATGRIPDAVAVDFDMSILSAGADIDVQLAGADLDRLRGAADDIKRRLAEYAGVYEIADSFRSGKVEMQMGIRPAAEILGLTLFDLGRQVRQAFYGEEVQRIQRGRDDVRVMLRYPRDDRRSLGDLENMRIRTPAGGEVPFRQVAQVDPGRGFAAIRRVDRSRTVNVTAAVDPVQASSGAVIADLRARVLPEVTARNPGVTYTFEGAQAEQADTIEGLQRGFLLAVLLIFGLLAIPLRSYWQPLVIMAAIPFGFVGAIWGHLLMRIDLTAMSMFGLVALTGVVINDSLVMIDFINRARAAHAGGGGGQAGFRRAIREAGSERFRPIVLTSVTTFAGLVPLMLFESSPQALFLVPMAVSLAFGVLFATFVSLILVPTACLILDDMRRVLRRGFAAGQPAR